MARTVAAFDFDGTITRRDSLIPFLARLAGWPRVAWALARIAPTYVRDRDVAKEKLLTALLRGVPHADVASAGMVYGVEVARSQIRPAMRDKLAWHRGEGHEIVIVSASLDVYLREVADALGIDALLCTQLEVDEAGRCTGRMLGGNCRGEGKATRLRAHLGEDECVLWAYGNSSGDAAMLAMADHPVRV